jgi:hypothetical protein
VRVPLNIQGVQPDPAAKRAGDELRYDIEAQFYARGKAISIASQDPADLLPTNAWSVVRRYLQASIDGKTEDLKPLMSAEAWQVVSKVDPKAIQARAKNLRANPRFVPLFGLEHQGHSLLHWLDPRGSVDVLPLRKRPDGSFEMHPFNAGVDPTTGNLFQYAFYRPEPPRAAEMDSRPNTWKRGQDAVKLAARVSRPESYVVILRDRGPGRPLQLLGMVKDDSGAEAMMRFADMDLEPGKVRFALRTLDLDGADPFQLYAIEMNYPPASIPSGAQTLATQWTLTPPAAR